MKLFKYAVIVLVFAGVIVISFFSMNIIRFFLPSTVGKTEHIAPPGVSTQGVNEDWSDISDNFPWGMLDRLRSDDERISIHDIIDHVEKEENLEEIGPYLYFYDPGHLDALIHDFLSIMDPDNMPEVHFDFTDHIRYYSFNTLEIRNAEVTTVNGDTFILDLIMKAFYSPEISYYHYYPSEQADIPLRQQTMQKEQLDTKLNAAADSFWNELYTGELPYPWSDVKSANPFLDFRIKLDQTALQSLQDPNQYLLFDYPFMPHLSHFTLAPAPDYIICFYRDSLFNSYWFTDLPIWNSEMKEPELREEYPYFQMFSLIYDSERDMVSGYYIFY